tara:strand:+ start:380 stop:508 length:129 start_codon:yes stop_codon:yes gene_type:complete
MEANESETIHNLRACQAILTKLFEKHEGRFLKQNNVIQSGSK